jgi:hypothetical protein
MAVDDFTIIPPIIVKNSPKPRRSWNDIRSPVGAMSVNALLPLGRPAPRRFPPADMISVNLISIKNQFKLAAA